MDWKNIKTTLSGYGSYIFSLGFFVQAIVDWSYHKPVEWRSVAVAVVLAVIGYGLHSAKDATTHSTLPQMQLATAQAQANPETKAVEEQKVGKAAIEEVKKL